jgi:hypothetical protein
MIHNHLKKAGAALLIVVLSAIAAFAINVDQTRTVPRRTYSTDQTHFWRFTVNYNDPRISIAPQQFAALGNLGYVSRIVCDVTTAFNAGTTNQFAIYTTPTSPNGAVVAPTGSATAAVNLSSATIQDLTAAAGLGFGATSGGDVQLYAMYGQSGTAATAGAMTCVIEYEPNIDQ